MTRPFFARDRVTDFDLFNRHAEVVVNKLKERFAQGEAIDFQVCTPVTVSSRSDSRIYRISCRGLHSPPNGCYAHYVTWQIHLRFGG